MLAGCVPHAACPPGMDATAHDEQCGKAAWVFDRATKNFLVRCWKDRRKTVGILNVSHGVLTRTLATRTPLAVRSRWATQNPFPPERRAEWRQFSPSAVRDQQASSSRRDGPCGFYVVWAGRKLGVFYRWCDVAASVAGFTGAKFKGFDSQRAAETAFAAGFS